jgi:hypothetical protein
LRALAPLFAVAVAVLAVVTDTGSELDLILAAVPVAAFAVWAFVRRVPLPALAALVLVPVVVAQRAGLMEPLMFEASLLALVVGGWAGAASGSWGWPSRG